MSPPAPLPIAPPLRTLAAHLESTGDRVTSTETHFPDNPAASFEVFRTRGWRSADDGPIPAQTLVQSYANVVKVMTFTRTMVSRIPERGGTIGDREGAALSNVFMASQIIHAALLTHLREDPFYEFGTLILLRSALDVTAKAAFIANGCCDEPARWNLHRDPVLARTHRNRSIRVAECWDACHAITQRTPEADDPKRVYEWLCGYTHLDSHAIELGSPSHIAGFAGLAYASWFCAAVADVVFGCAPFAIWPAGMPTPRPWLASASP